MTPSPCARAGLQVQATNDAARYRTEHLAVLADAERQETVRRYEAERSLATLKAQQVEETERVAHARKMADVRNTQSIADAEAALRVAELKADAAKASILGEYGSHTGFLSVQRARTMADALSKCPQSLDMKMEGVKYLLNHASDDQPILGVSVD